jgi:rare lipoprotein A
MMRGMAPHAEDDAVAGPMDGTRTQGLRGDCMRFEMSGPEAARRSTATGRLVIRVMTVAALASVVANCGSQQVGSSRSIDPKYGVAPSPRVVAEGEPVPKGGGRELVGRAYVVAGRTYVPQDVRRYVREGLASWYGTAFHGRLTANGEVFDRYSIAAAHPTMPLPSYARVTNLKNSRSMIVRVNDRGPYHGNRLMDVSERVAEALEFKRAGTARVRVEYVSKASLRGSDDEKLLATLREDGRPAPFPGMTAPIMVADRGGAPPPRPQAFAFRFQEPGEADEGFGEAPSTERSASPARGLQPVLAGSTYGGAPQPPVRPGNAPLPPQRPLDLDTIPGAATPVRGRTTPVAQLPGARSAHASLFFADPGTPPSRLIRDDPFKDMKPQRFVALKGQP